MALPPSKSLPPKVKGSADETQSQLTATKAWQERIMANMKRRNTDEAFRRKIAQKLS